MFNPFRGWFCIMDHRNPTLSGGAIHGLTPLFDAMILICEAGYLTSNLSSVAPNAAQKRGTPFQK